MLEGFALRLMSLGFCLGCAASVGVAIVLTMFSSLAVWSLSIGAICICLAVVALAFWLERDWTQKDKQAETDWKAKS